MVRNRFAWPTVAAEAFWFILAWLCFWGRYETKTIQIENVYYLCPDIEVLRCDADLIDFGSLRNCKGAKNY